MATQDSNKQRTIGRSGGRTNKPLLGMVVVALLAGISLPLFSALVISPTYSHLLAKTFEDGARRLAEYTIPPALSNAPLTPESLHDTHFLADIYRLEQDLGVWKIRVYSYDGKVIYSTRESEVGNLVYTDGSRELHSKLRSWTRRLSNGVTVDIDVVEVFYPIIHLHEFLGAFEFHFDITDTQRQIVRFNNYTLYGTLALCFILMIMISILLRMESARRKVDKRAKKLKEDVELITRHDLKSPLLGILNGISFLEQFTELDETQNEMVTDMREAANTGLATINNSLDLYKMEEGTYQFTPVNVDILDLLQRLTTNLNEFAVGAGVTLNLLVDGKGLRDMQTLIIRTEPTMCYSLFANLVKNAVEASDAGKEVTISVTDGTSLVVAVHNNRPVPEAIRETFFEKYATEGKVSGTGLGTYSAQLMAQTMGGSITMRTSEAEGTTVTVQLPNNPNPKE